MNNAVGAERAGALWSPWPPLVAFGFVVSELGVLFGIIPVVVGGLLLFGGSCAGILHETDYVRTVWLPLKGLGVLFVIAGGILWVSTVSVTTVDATLQAVEQSKVALRGASILVGGVLLGAGGFIGPKWMSRIAS